MNRPLLKSLVLMCGLLLTALGSFISSLHSGHAQVRSTTVIRPDTSAQTGNRTWGRLANPGYRNEAIKTTLFFAGRPLDGTGSANPNDPLFNGAGPSANAQSCYSVHPRDSFN